MYRIMIVDDEVWVRKGLKEQIDWSTLQVEYIGEAADGEEAYELVKELKPDIILTDVKMPFVDGIQFMEQIYQDYPAIKVIVISGYSEFELVQKAMVNKAVNYILKPINEKDLNQSISLAIIEIERNRTEMEEKLNLKMTVNQSLSALKEKYMSQIISNTGTGNHDFKKLLTELQLNFEYNQFQIAIVQILNYFEVLKRKFKNDAHSFHFAINNIINTTNLNVNHFISFKNTAAPDEYVILIGHATNEKNDNSNKSVETLLVKSILNLKQYLNLNSVIGVGRVYNKSDHIPFSYSEAVHSIKQISAHPSGDILYFDNIHNKNVKNDSMAKIIEYIQLHYSENITLESIAEKFYFNPSYLSRAFKLELGENFIDYVVRFRIEQAIKFMINPNLKIFEIAEMVGYENTNYFSKSFRKIMNYSPAEYRESLRNEQG